LLQVEVDDSITSTLNILIQEFATEYFLRVINRRSRCMSNDFPAVGNRYLVDFQAFKVILNFTSTTSLTYTVLQSDGSSGQIETVTIAVEPIRDQLFLVTWQEGDKTTVVHVEDYDAKTIVTNITNPDLSFDQFHGVFQQMVDAVPVPPSPLTYSHDIRPLFRANDIACMDPRGKKLDDPTWMCVPANAQLVYAAVSAGRMPPDGRWSPDKVTLFKQWMDDGYNP
jgi:hypothetical protein